jgi:hypothetical protein
LIAALASRGADAAVSPESLGPAISMAEEIRAKYSQAPQAQ